MKKNATILDALTILREHDGAMPVDQFLAALRISGFAVQRLEPTLYPNLPNMVECADCGMPTEAHSMVSCLVCNASLCPDCLYVCEGCYQPICARHFYGSQCMSCKQK